MAAQLNYNYSTPKGVPGGKFDLADDVVASRINEEESGVLKFGVAVAQGASVNKGIKLPTAASSKIVGVVLANANTEQDKDGKVIVEKGRTVGVLTHGHVWGRTATDVTPVYGAKAYVVASGAEAGYFTTSSTGTIDINAKFGNVTDEGIAVIELA